MILANFVSRRATVFTKRLVQKSKHSVLRVTAFERSQIVCFVVGQFVSYKTDQLSSGALECQTDCTVGRFSVKTFQTANLVTSSAAAVRVLLRAF